MDKQYKQLGPWPRYCLVGLGWFSIILGVVGIFLPVLPTTPFILLAAWSFARSSERFHLWLLNHRRLGPIVHAWQSGEGIPHQVRNRVILLLWFSLLSTSLLIAKLWLAVVLLLIGTSTTIYLIRQPVT